jgi:hypothetical protein
VYVYRDTGGQPDEPAAATPGPDEHDAAYWYDLPGTDGGGDTTPRVPQETRGPFEPLVSSAAPPGTTPRFSVSIDDAEPAAPDAAHTGDAPEPAPGHGQEDTEYAHASKLEQIKDLYLTAEAIGEANVDKHFDQLLAQQRELISEYFKQSNAARPADGSADQAGTEPDGAAGHAGTEPDGAAGTEPGGPGDAGGPASVPESTRVAADQPRVW